MTHAVHRSHTLHPATGILRSFVTDVETALAASLVPSSDFKTALVSTLKTGSFFTPGGTSVRLTFAVSEGTKLLGERVSGGLRAWILCSGVEAKSIYHLLKGMVQGESGRFGPALPLSWDHEFIHNPKGGPSTDKARGVYGEEEEWSEVRIQLGFEFPWPSAEAWSSQRSLLEGLIQAVFA